MSATVIIAGASVRAAAESAARAGYRVLAADLFRDSDTEKHAKAVQVDDYPNGLLDASRAWPPSDWLYTGGLENEPALIEAISQRHRLCGTGPSSLLRVRDPWTLYDILRQDGLLFPTPSRQPDWTRACKWIWKPVRGCGGTRIVRVERSAGVHVARRSVDAPVQTDPRWSRGYFQPLVAGPSFSAQFVAADSRAVLLGITRQLVGCRWAGAEAFHYTGSIGPVRLEPVHVRSVRRIGACLARYAALVGLFGVDFVINRRGVWTLDVNPRFCASIEILERAHNVSAIALHMRASSEGRLPDWPRISSASMHGKAIVFSPRTTTVGRSFFRHIARLQACHRLPSVSDIPRSANRIVRGGPVVTVFAQGANVRTVTRQLQARAHALRVALDR